MNDIFIDLDESDIDDFQELIQDDGADDTDIYFSAALTTAGLHSESERLAIAIVTVIFTYKRTYFYFRQPCS